jgi:hypothetical protein
MKTTLILSNCSNPIIKSQALEIASCGTFNTIEVETSHNGKNIITTTKDSLKIVVSDTITQIPKNLMNYIKNML